MSAEADPAAPAVEFWYDFGSPNAWLAWWVLPALVERCGARLVPRPMLLGGVFKATGNQPPLLAFAGVRGKPDYIRREVERFIARHDVPFRWNPHFPVNTLRPMRGAVAVQGSEAERPYMDAMFRAIWVEGRDISDPEVMAEVIEAAGLDAGAIMAAIETDAVKSALRAATEEAVARGIFGAPSFTVGEELFFGKDALPELEWWLTGGAEKMVAQRR